MGQSTKRLKWKRKERKKMKEKKKLPKRQSAQSWVEIPWEVKVTCLLLERPRALRLWLAIGSCLGFLFGLGSGCESHTGTVSWARSGEEGLWLLRGTSKI